METRDLFFVCLFFLRKKKIRWFKLDNANSDAELEQVIDLSGQDCSGSRHKLVSLLSVLDGNLDPPHPPPGPNTHSQPSPLVFRPDVKKLSWLVFVHWRAGGALFLPGGRDVSGHGGVGGGGGEGSPP